MNKIKCPKCGGYNVSSKLSSGGLAIYEQLVCNDCNFEGGASRVYSGENDRVKKEIVERFLKKDTSSDAVRSTLASYGL